MLDEPKVDTNIYIDNSDISGVVNSGNVGDSSIVNQTDLPNTENKSNWQFWLGLAVAIIVGGPFKEEVRKFLFDLFN
jgi:hypothetical protein